MRRAVLIGACLGVLAVPAAAYSVATGDGQLVVKNASGTRNVPVVAINSFKGSVIGKVHQGRIVIDGGVGGAPPEVTGYDWRGTTKASPTAQVFGGTDFKFRIIGDPDAQYTIVIYGTDINLLALGHGTAALNGLPDDPTGDGTYSLNGGEPRSLPGAARVVTIASNG